MVLEAKKMFRRKRVNESHPEANLIIKGQHPAKLWTMRQDCHESATFSTHARTDNGLDRFEIAGKLRAFRPESQPFNSHYFHSEHFKDLENSEIRVLSSYFWDLLFRKSFL